MKKDKYKVQVGDTLYQASKSYNKVFTTKAARDALGDVVKIAEDTDL